MTETFYENFTKAKIDVSNKFFLLNMTKYYIMNTLATYNSDTPNIDILFALPKMSLFGYVKAFGKKNINFSFKLTTNTKKDIY